MTAPGVLDSRAAEFGDRVLLRIDDDAVTFAQMRDRSIAAAHVLADVGVTRGDTVALFSGSTLHWVYFWFAAARLGAIPAAVNAANKGASLRHALDVCGARVVYTDTAERCRRVFDVAAGRDCVVLSDEVDEHAYANVRETAATLARAGSVPLQTAACDAGALFFTSGTTGPSKAVATSWQYLFTAAATVASAWELTAGETIWSAMPLFHLSAVGTILAPMLVGGTAVLASAFHPTTVWQEMRTRRAIGFVGAGAMVSMLWKLPPDVEDCASGLRFISAAPIGADLYRGIEDRYGCRVVTMYGMTEAFPIAVKAVGDDGVPGTSGRTNPDLDVAVLDPGGEPVFGAVGEIVCRARTPDAMSRGYFDARGGKPALRPHDSWFRTGDLGRIDADGNLTYVDRLKDAIRRRGENVSSVEVEAVVSSYPGVAEAAAVGVPSELGEEDVLVVLSLAPDAALDPGELLDFCADRLPYFCVPRYIRIVDALPRNVIGRVRKDVLRGEGVGPTGWDRDAHGYVVRR